MVRPPLASSSVPAGASARHAPARPGAWGRGLLALLLWGSAWQSGAQPVPAAPGAASAVVVGAVASAPAGAASAPALPADWARAQDQYWHAPRTVDFIRRLEALQQAMDQHCQGGLVIPVRTAWREALVAWLRLSAVPGPDLLAPEVLTRLDAPARAELIEQAIEAAAEGTLQADRLAPGARGLGALEWLLWTQPPGVSLKAPPSRSRSTAAPSRRVAKPAAKGAATKSTKTKAAAKTPARRAQLDAGGWGGAADAVGAVLLRLEQAASAPQGYRAQASKPKPAAPAKARKTNAKPARSTKATKATKPSRTAAAAVAAEPVDPLLAGGRSAAGQASRTAQPAACRLGRALVADLRTQSLGLADALARRLEAAPVLAVAASAPSATAPAGGDRLGAGWLEALVQLRVQALEQPLQAEAHKGRAGLPLPRQLSGSASVDRVSRWSALRALAVGEEGGGPAGPGLQGLAWTTRLQQAGHAELAEQLLQQANAVDQALEAALPNTPPVLHQAAEALARLEQLVVRQVLPALS
ncbi:hypothetical protein [Ideonella livida]|uniref:Imelysin-like domain-containing protein n=1 Tax=Ideonella livida TaxID=2707176 RepID=A0A7C9TLH7_9BURK|nr:hypothetical protein [Ideonella livida]NDY91587.1 hypothetical protein [Ideonella livida]